jgi:hypothetical protein
MIRRLERAEAYRWANRAKESAWRVWPMTWITWASKSRRPSDANLMGLESSKVDAATAAAQQSNRRIDETKRTRAISLSLSVAPNVVEVRVNEYVVG